MSGTNPIDPHELKKTKEQIVGKEHKSDVYQAPLKERVARKAEVAKEKIKDIFHAGHKDEGCKECASSDVPVASTGEKLDQPRVISSTTTTTAWNGQNEPRVVETSVVMPPVSNVAAGSVPPPPGPPPAFLPNEPKSGLTAPSSDLQSQPGKTFVGESNFQQKPLEQ